MCAWERRSSRSTRRVNRPPCAARRPTWAAPKRTSRYLAWTSQTARSARRRGSDQPSGIRAGTELAATGRSQTRGTRGAGARRAGPARLLPRRRRAGGNRRGHCSSRGRPCDELDGHHHNRRQLRPRGVHSGSAGSLARSEARPRGSTARFVRRGRGDQPHHVRGAPRGRRDADGPREERAQTSYRHPCACSSSFARASSGAR